MQMPYFFAIHEVAKKGFVNFAMDFPFCEKGASPSAVILLLQLENK